LGLVSEYLHVDIGATNAKVVSIAGGSGVTVQILR
jgi:hypothetical protein